MGRVLPIVLLAVLVPAYSNVLSTLSMMHKRLPTGNEVCAVLPSPILKITSLDNDGIVSDILYLKTLIFYGSTYDGKMQRAIQQWEYSWMFQALNTATDLDPYFLDPYLLANGVLSWEAKMVQETNLLLAKGSRFREWDYWLPFYAGFNYYFFLGDSAKGAELMMEASKKQGASPFFGFLAARLSYAGNRTENAIIFLDGLLKTTKDQALRKDYETRLEALQKILSLEKAAAVFKERNGSYPNKLEVLVDQHIIDSLPKDPYGGKFYIDGEGAVKTTSDLRYMKKK